MPGISASNGARKNDLGQVQRQGMNQLLPDLTTGSQSNSESGRLSLSSRASFAALAHHTRRERRVSFSVCAFSETTRCGPPPAGLAPPCDAEQLSG